MGIRVNGKVIESTPNKNSLEAAKELLDNPDFQPVEPRFAATVMLVRNSCPGHCSGSRSCRWRNFCLQKAKG